MTCRICLDDGDTVCVCGCRGTQAHVHLECVRKWIQEKRSQNCELCHQPWSRDIYVSVIRENYAPLALLIGCIINMFWAYVVWFETCLWPNEMSVYIILSMSLISLSIITYLWFYFLKPYKLSNLYLIVWCVIFFIVSGVLEAFCQKLEISSLYLPYSLNVSVHFGLVIYSLLIHRIREPQNTVTNSF